MEETEAMLRDELREMIKYNTSVPEFGTIDIIILAVPLVGSILFVTKNKLMTIKLF
tara:strand:+ start:421 stop:588 length:168 start_codon:yes stop_codon:yes gene_type:complete